MRYTRPHRVSVTKKGKLMSRSRSDMQRLDKSYLDMVDAREKFKLKEFAIQFLPRSSHQLQKLSALTHFAKDPRHVVRYL